MSVIIRLQNLPWSANALDIRQYFHGLNIPEGGVHIVGGEQGDAFIAFSTDEDARLAFERNNGKIKEIQIKLMLSSRTEMQRVIEAARNQTLAAFMQPTPAPAPVQLPSIIPPLVGATLAPTFINKDDRDSDKEKDKNDKRDKKRSRSRSRDRSDRSRDRDRRDRRRRDRSRSRSRDRRDRRRRDRSYSRERDRHRSKERSRKNSRDRKKSPEKIIQTTNQMSRNNIWEPPVIEQSPVNASLLEFQAKYNLNLTAPTLSLDRNNFPFDNQNKTRGSWPTGLLGNRPDDNGNIGLSLRNNFTDRFQVQTPIPINNLSPFGGSNSNSNFSENDIKNFNEKNWQSKMYSNSDDNKQDNKREFHENCCVKLYPFYGGFGAIRRFFHGLFIHNSGIKLINDKNGKRTGAVYVRFAYPKGKEEALKRSGLSIRNQTVDVEHIDDDEYDNEVDRYRPSGSIDDNDDDDIMEVESNIQNRPKNVSKLNKSQNQSTPIPDNFSCLLVEDLPTYVKEQDILKMFSDFSLMSIIITGKQRKNQVAYVNFSNVEDAKKAFSETSRHKLDGKSVTIRPCADEDFNKVNQQNEIIEEKPEELSPIKVESEYASLGGLPSTINERDIRDFFSDVGIFPEKVHLVNSDLDVQAVCEFANLREAEAAMAKNGMYLGTGVIQVKSISRNEYEDILGIKPTSNSIPQPLLGMNIGLPNNNGSNFNNRPPFFRNNFNNMGMNMNNRGGFFGPRPNRFPSHQHNAGGDNLTPQGCTVLMENVPYRANLDEILEFFHDFNVPPDNVLRRYNPNGQPSGETKIIFLNAEDARRAVQTKNREKIRDRIVYLSLC